MQEVDFLHTYAFVDLVDRGIHDPELIFPLREPLRRAAARGVLSGECWEGDWEDVGTAERYLALNRRLESTRSPGPAI